MVEQVAEEAEKTEEGENLPEEVLESDTVKQFADVGTETDSIIEAPVKTFVSVGTQTEPLDVFIDQPVAELTPERRRRNVVLDHPYTRKPEQDVDPQNAVTNVEPVSLAVQQNSVLFDESDEEWCDDVDDTGSVCRCDISDEDWNPEEHEDSDDESANFFHNPSINRLEENEEPCNESKSIIFDSCLKQLFQLCRISGAIVNNAYLKQKGSLICVTTVCKAGHIESWFSQPFTKGMAAGNLTCSGGILFTGNHFMRVSALMNACNIRFFEKGSTFGQW